MKNIYQHNIELEPIRINNADKATFLTKTYRFTISRL